MAKKEDELNFETDNNKMASSEKLKALQAAMDKIEKSFGKGSIMKMLKDVSIEPIYYVVYWFSIFEICYFSLIISYFNKDIPVWIPVIRAIKFPSCRIYMIS